MFNRESILKDLNAENYYIDKHSLDLFLNDWKIDSIYEDESGLEFYDDLSLDKIKRGISLKAQGFTDEQIISKLAKMEAKVQKKEEPVEPILIKDYLDTPQETQPELLAQDVEVENEEEHIVTDLTPQRDKSFTLDVSSQTLQMLAESVAKKITDDIKNSDMAEKLIEAGGYKRDNEILSEQISELIEHNKKLAERIEQLEKKESFFEKLINLFK